MAMGTDGMKILVVDDLLENRLLLRALLGKEHQVIEAENGQQAVDRYRDAQPDLVLMDVKMPVMDGIAATKMIRSLKSDKWVPIFMVSALDDESSIVSGLHAGADDYLTKPVNHAILKAKLVSVIRALKMQAQIIDGCGELKAYRQQNEKEQAFAHVVFNKLLSQSELEGDYVQSWIRPASRFSGDLMCIEWVGNDSLYFILADSTGHGLSAALPTLMVNQIFRTMAKKSISIAEMAREVNLRLQKVLPVGHFVALGLGVIDFNERSIEIWNGGLPDIQVFSNRGQILATFKSEHVFAGVLGDGDFDDTTVKWSWPQDCELVLYSDGAIDACDSEGRFFSESRILQVLADADFGRRNQSLRNEIENFIDPGIEHDDISCLAIQCKAML